MNGLQTYLIKELILMVILYHDNVLKFGLETITRSQNLKKFQIFLYNIY